jgi:hypothetical protein
MKKYEYTYKIKDINIAENALLVEYMATDESLTSYTLHIPSYILNEDETRKTIDEVIKFCAPHGRWESQEILVEQYNDILHKTELVPIQNA